MILIETQIFNFTDKVWENFTLNCSDNHFRAARDISEDHRQKRGLDKKEKCCDVIFSNSDSYYVRLSRETLVSRIKNAKMKTRPKKK